jgi:dihydroxyacetone kinase-like predicted kinase
MFLERRIFMQASTLSASLGSIASHLSNEAQNICVGDLGEPATQQQLLDMAEAISEAIKRANQEICHYLRSSER